MFARVPGWLWGLGALAASGVFLWLLWMGLAPRHTDRWIAIPFLVLSGSAVAAFWRCYELARIEPEELEFLRQLRRAELKAAIAMAEKKAAR